MESKGNFLIATRILEKIKKLIKNDKFYYYNYFNLNYHVRLRILEKSIQYLILWILKVQRQSSFIYSRFPGTTKQTLRRTYLCKFFD